MNEILASSVVTYLPFIYVSMCTQNISFLSSKHGLKQRMGIGIAWKKLVVIFCMDIG